MWVPAAEGVEGVGPLAGEGLGCSGSCGFRLLAAVVCGFRLLWGLWVMASVGIGGAGCCRGCGFQLLWVVDSGSCGMLVPAAVGLVGVACCGACVSRLVWVLV